MADPDTPPLTNTEDVNAAARAKRDREIPIGAAVRAAVARYRAFAERNEVADPQSTLDAYLLAELVAQGLPPCEAQTVVGE